MHGLPVIRVLSLSFLIAGCGGVPVNHTPIPGSQAAIGAVPMGSEENPVRVSGGVMAGTVLTKENPIFLGQTLHEHVSGAVVLAVIVDPSGKVASAKVISGPEALRASCVATVERWTYRPFLLNGRPVYVQTTVTVIMDFGAG